jgi:hypothetical protein
MIANPQADQRAGLGVVAGGEVGLGFAIGGGEGFVDWPVVAAGGGVLEPA